MSGQPFGRPSRFGMMAGQQYDKLKKTMKLRLSSALIVVVLILAGATASLSLLYNARARSEAAHLAAVHLERGIGLYQRKDYVHAEGVLRRALRTNPDDWRAPFYVGVIQIERQRYGLAIPYLERALALNTREPKILNALGVVYFKLERLDMAKGYFWASLDLDPTNTEAKGLMETMAKLQRRAARTAAVEN